MMTGDLMNDLTNWDGFCTPSRCINRKARVEKPDEDFVTQISDSDEAYFLQPVGAPQRG